MTEYHETTATFTLPLTIAADTSSGPQTFAVTVTYQTCNDRFCLPPKSEKLERPDQCRFDGFGRFDGFKRPPATAPASLQR